MAITLRSVGASPGANSSNCIITKPAGLALGDFMLAHVVNKATSGTITPPANWTIIGAQSNTASSRSALFYKFADAADVAASTFTFTLGTTGRNRGEMAAWLGVDTSSPINAANQQINSAGTSIAVPTPTVTDGCRVLVFGSNALGGVATACSGTDPACTITLGYAVAYSSYCALACFSGTKSGTDAIDTHSLSTFTSAVSSGHAVALTPAVPPEEHSGSAAISGLGHTASAVQKNGKGSALTSGAGTLLAIGVVAMMGLASLSGGPGHQTASASRATSGTTAISGNGTTTATGVKYIAPEEHSGSAAISGGGSLFASGTKATSNVAAISGAGHIGALGAMGAQSTASISGAGALSGTGAKVASGVGAISGKGTLAASGIAVEFHYGTTAISGNGSFVTVGLKAGAGTSGPVSANGSQVAAGIKAGAATSAISGNGSLAATGVASEGGTEPPHFGTASISGSGTTSGVGQKSALGTTGISGNGSLSASGIAEETGEPTGTASISGGGSPSSVGTKATSAWAGISVCGHLEASGSKWVYQKTSVDPKFWASKNRRKRDRVYRTSSKRPGCKQKVG